MKTAIVYLPLRSHLLDSDDVTRLNAVRTWATQNGYTVKGTWIDNQPYQGEPPSDVLEALHKLLKDGYADVIINGLDDVITLESLEKTL